MLSDLQAQFLYIAPLLPISVASTYIISVVFKWEQALARRMYGDRTHNKKDMKFSLPTDTTEVKLQEDSTWISHITDTAVPIAHHYLTSTRLWNLDKSELISVNVCLVQIAIVVVEFAINCFRDNRLERLDLFALGASWSGMALRSQFAMLRSGWTGISSSTYVAALGIISILPAKSMMGRELSIKSIPQVRKSDKVDSSTAESTTPRTSNVHLHIFSVSLLLVYLVHDYPTVSSKLLYRFPWMGSASHWLIAFGLMFLREGVDDWRTTSRPHQTLTQHSRVLVSRVYTDTKGFDRSCVIIPLSVAGAWISLFFISNYLTSCLGFRSLVLGQSRTMPQFLDGGVFGGFAYQMVVSLQLVLRRDQLRGHKPGHMFRLMMAFVTAFGQTITGLVTLAIGLYGLQVLGWIENPSHSCCCSSI